MREIKFRAWNSKYKFMYDNIVTFPGNDCSFYYHADRHPENNHLPGGETELKDVIVMQYTGLKDKYGKEIYEGDIVESTILGQKFRGEVRWDTMCYRVAGDDFDITLGDDKQKTRRIVGNIYENEEKI